MTLDDLIKDLGALRKQMGKDIPVRIVTREGPMGWQFPAIDARVVDMGTNHVILILGGDSVAQMDWPNDALGSL